MYERIEVRCNRGNEEGRIQAIQLVQAMKCNRKDERLRNRVVVDMVEILAENEELQIPEKLLICNLVRNLIDDYYKDADFDEIGRLIGSIYSFKAW